MPFSVWILIVFAIITIVSLTGWIAGRRAVLRLERTTPERFAVTDGEFEESRGTGEGRKSQKDHEKALDAAREDRKIARGLAIAFSVLTLLTLAFASHKQVSTKNVGIVTSFGSPSGELSNGLHFTWPWLKIHEMDAAIQTDSYTDKSGDCVRARIGNQQTACVDASIRWRIVPGHAPELYRDYRSFEHVRDSLVTRELKAAINQQLANYNPLNSIAITNNPSGGVNNPTLGQIAARVTAQMRREIGADIEVINTFIPLIGFDPQTQSRLNQLQQQIALTRIAEQAEKTARAQAAANNALSASVSNAPNVLVAHCLDTLATMVKNDQAVPVGFSCWPSSGVAAVIAGSSSK